MSVFGLPSHQLADVSPMKELRRQLAATARRGGESSPSRILSMGAATATVTAANDDAANSNVMEAGWLEKTRFF
jgi:hypothetical protein